jgi:hypothetical protein
MRWVAVAVPTFLVLLVSVPVMVVEEDWHGHPMIDEGTLLWILPALLVASAFLGGGALVGLLRPSSAVAHALVPAGVALVALLIGALIRRLWVVHEGVPRAVVNLWCIGVLTAVGLSLVGSLIGRRLATDR